MKEKKAVTALSALAQESRLAIFRLLMGEGKKGLAAGDISRTLDIPATTASFHLAQLKNAGLIKSWKEGRSVIYAANRKQVKRLAAFVTAKSPDMGDYAL